MKPTPSQMSLENIHCLLIDLDDTLYPQESGAWELVGDRIDQFLIQEMGFLADEATTLRSRLFHQYGTTLRGLQIEFEVDMDFYLDYVHDVPLEHILSPDPDLDRMLAALPQRKVIFTNAYAPHAHRVINILGIQNHFDLIIDIHAIYPHCKPEIEAFRTAIALIKEEPKFCLLVDDNPSNLVIAQSLGMMTVSIGKHHHSSSPHIPDIKALSQLLLPDRYP